MRTKSHWVQNITRDRIVSFTVADKRYDGSARIVDPENEAVLAMRVKGLMNQEYGWSSGTIVELSPVSGAW